jgi:hypothetical protein
MASRSCWMLHAAMPSFINAHANCLLRLRWGAISILPSVRAYLASGEVFSILAQLLWHIPCSRKNEAYWRLESVCVLPFVLFPIELSVYHLHLIVLYIFRRIISLCGLLVCAHDVVSSSICLCSVCSARMCCSLWGFEVTRERKRVGRKELSVAWHLSCIGINGNGTTMRGPHVAVMSHIMDPMCVHTGMW